MVEDAGTNERLQEVAKEWNLPALLQENPCQARHAPRATLASTVEVLLWRCLGGLQPQPCRGTGRYRAAARLIDVIQETHGET